MKKGITAISVAIMITIIFILLGTITVSSYNSIQNAKKIVFALEISNIQEETNRYIENADEDDYPILNDVFKISIANVSSSSEGQFTGEETDADGNITLYELDLSVLGIDDVQYGRKTTNKDIYVFSKDTKKVYYLEGIKFGDKTYYTLTQDLIDIKEKNEKEEENVVVNKPTINTAGAIVKTLSTGEEEIYVSDIEFTGENIKTVKYELEIIDESLASEYFTTSGNSIIGDRIKLQDYSSVTLYVENSKGEYDIKYRGYPKIPEGFMASDLEDEDEVSEGLVIYEGTEKVSTDEDAQTTRNQFVWIPVQNINEFERINWKNEADFFGTYIEPYDAGYATEVEEYNKMKSSIDKYGGFYIARYEAGKESLNNVDTVVSKKGVEVWQNVPWGKNSSNISEGAVYLAKSMYPESVASSNVVSTLCYGVQWDSSMNFLKDVPNPNTNGQKFIENSTGMGYYEYDSTNLLVAVQNVQEAGSNYAYKAKNIYDIAGNVMEWTMEYRATALRVRRDAYYAGAAYASPSQRRIATLASQTDKCYGFRVTLYLK